MKTSSVPLKIARDDLIFGGQKVASYASSRCGQGVHAAPIQGGA